MNDNEIELLTYYLNGFISSSKVIDSSVLAHAFVEKINIEDIPQSLNHIYKNVFNLEGVYEFKHEIKLSLNELQNSMEAYFFNNPFTIHEKKARESKKKAKYEFVFKIIDLIQMIRSRFIYKEIYSFEMVWKKAAYVF